MKTTKTSSPKKKTTPRKAYLVSETPLSIRLAPNLLVQLDQLADRIADDALQSTISGGSSRAAIIRLAIVEGFKVLEKRYPA